ncbi:MAG TPA: CPXCG motif-containing cysteine-rich protein [Planctomycetota bacterium]|nr:CPXCG motif-containing cysteine-rich protein [Planctomycetota bacterium]
MGDPDREDDDREGDAGQRADDEAAYVCGSCGETIVVPLDPSAGRHQRYVEDCPVCCSPNEIAVEFDADGAAHVTGRPEGQ